ncbi:MAG: hypothetical protein IJ882_08015, partial [Paludibacteraceae bacterium]|nr:hypothetical protein [Paludibacteraceae bacterium]
VAEHSDLDEVWLMVSPNNPLKVNAQLQGEYDLRTNFAARLDAARKALAETGCSKPLRASDFEDSLPRPSYTANTLRELQKAYPQHEFSLIIGADNWAIIEQWKEYDFVLQNFRLFVYPRQGAELFPRPTFQPKTSSSAPTHRSLISPARNSVQRSKKWGFLNKISQIICVY